MSLERADVFPLRVTDFRTLPNLDPSAFENRLTVAHKGLAKPGNHSRRFRAGMTRIDVGVGEGEVVRILARCMN
jgi:hypothetical protein